ncbi:MAG: hypothetical protein H0U92_03385 [Actinobacteria bacterium]|nr:hypothetical protein [Actinomycetota bacterium]
MLWYSAIFMVVVIGVLGVALSSKNIADKQASAEVTPPTKKDHWHAAYGFNLCGEWASALNDGAAGDTTGIHTHGDGLIHTHPFLNSVTGKNATFGKLMKITDTAVTATSVDLKRDNEKLKNGDKCGSKPGVLTARSFKNLEDKAGTELKGSPSAWRIKDGTLITISFNPKGFKVEQPPSAGNLSDPKDLGQTPQPTPASTPAPTSETTSAPPTSAP